ncbi:ATP-binding protein [Clavibacter michiganensis]|nr:ATP-binding protein [Clavibacter michiganensis]
MGELGSTERRSVGRGSVSAALRRLRVIESGRVPVLMSITPGLPETDNFQHWSPWRPLVVETARRVLQYAAGTLVMPMTVLVEEYWREISSGLAGHGIRVQHFVLHADTPVLHDRIMTDEVMGPSRFRLAHLAPYEDAARTWLHDDAEVIDTTSVAPHRVARQIADSVLNVGNDRSTY